MSWHIFVLVWGEAFVERVNHERGTTIMLTTHDLADVERLCKRIIFIDKGRVLFDGAVSELKRRYAPYRELNVTLAPNGSTDEIPFDMAGAEIVSREERHLVVRFDPERVAATDVISAVVGRFPVSDIAIVEPALEGVVREIVESGEVRA